MKDLFDTAGIPTTCGSPRILGGNVPTRTATAVERLEQAGAVLLGKLHMTEFAFIAHHPDTRPAQNPWATGPLAGWLVQRLGSRGGVLGWRARRSEPTRRRRSGCRPPGAAPSVSSPRGDGCRATASSRWRRRSITWVRSRGASRTQRSCSTVSPVPIPATPRRGDKRRRLRSRRRETISRVCESGGTKTT